MSKQENELENRLIEKIKQTFSKMEYVTSSEDLESLLGKILLLLAELEMDYTYANLAIEATSKIRKMIKNQVMDNPQSLKTVNDPDRYKAAYKRKLKKTVKQIQKNIQPFLV